MGMFRGMRVGMLVFVLVRVSVLMCMSMSMIVGMIMAAAPAVFMRMIVIVIMLVIMLVIAAVGFFGADGGEIEESEHAEPDAGHEHHGPEPAGAGEVFPGGEPSAGVEVEHDPAPEQDQEHAKKVEPGARSFHGWKLAGRSLA